MPSPRSAEPERFSSAPVYDGADRDTNGPVEIRTARLVLRELEPGEVGDSYVAWLNDPVVCRYLEVRHVKHTHADVVSYVAENRACRDCFLFAIRFDGRHVGNIRLGPIDRRHALAEVGFLIGERAIWGRGVATEAIRAVTSWAFAAQEVAKTVAGLYAPNVGSARALVRAGYRLEAVRPRHFLLDGRRCDVHEYARIRRCARTKEPKAGAST